jgi:hypothetical protein
MPAQSTVHASRADRPAATKVSKVHEVKKDPKRTDRMVTVEKTQENI